jgi:Flp pilus assembly protein TadG
MKRTPTRRGRGVALLEFMFVLPLFLFLALFAVDMGRVMLAYGALSDSTYVAARSAAQAGSASQFGGDSVRAFYSSLSAVPGIDQPGTAKLTINNGTCSVANKYITMTGSKAFNFVTPGLGTVLATFTRSTSSEAAYNRSWTMSARAVVLCEVVRR